MGYRCWPLDCDQRLWRGPDDVEAVEPEEVHVRTGVRQAKHAVDVECVSAGVNLEPLADDDLERLARLDLLDRGTDGLAVLLRRALAPDWKGDTGRVESFFEGARLDDLEKRLGLPPGGFTPKNVVIFICGLTGTITGTIIPLLDRGFVPDFKRIREALGVPADIKDSVFYEQYDTEPVINVKDPAVVEPLKVRMQAGLAKLQ